MSTPVSSSASIRAILVTSADEAVSLTRATEIFQADTFISAALMGLQTAKPVLDRFLQISQVAALIAKRATGSFVPISVTSLEATSKNSSALRALFNADGPVLGSNLDEANSNYAALLSAGIELNAPIQTPVLIETDRADGKPSTKSVTWLSADQLSLLAALPKANASAYPGSVERTWELRDAKGKVIQVIRYTIFDDYANRRPQLSSLADGLVLLTQMVSDTAEQLSLELKFAQRASAEADRKLESSDAFKKEQDVLIMNIQSANDELIESSQRLMQFMHRERQLLIIRQEAIDKKSANSPIPAIDFPDVQVEPVGNIYESSTVDDRRLLLDSSSLGMATESERHNAMEENFYTEEVNVFEKNLSGGSKKIGVNSLSKEKTWGSEDA